MNIGFNFVLNTKGSVNQIEYQENYKKTIVMTDTTKQNGQFILEGICKNED